MASSGNWVASNTLRSLQTCSPLQRKEYGKVPSHLTWDLNSNDTDYYSMYYVLNFDFYFQLHRLEFLAEGRILGSIN